MPKTLLLADDSVVIQKLVALSFANEDIELVTVYNGDDAITKIRETRPDLVLTDVVMPGKSGYEVCEAVKGDPSLSHVPVLLLTGTFETFDEERASRAGADGHITKPFEAQALVNRVNQLLAAPPAPRAESPAAAPAAEPAGPPAASASATPAPPAAATVAASGEVFDFFDDELDASLESESDDGVISFGDEVEIGSQAASEPLAVRDDALTSSRDPFEMSGDPLSFGDPPTSDRTVAIMPDDPEFGSEDARPPAAPAVEDQATITASRLFTPVTAPAPPPLPSFAPEVPPTPAPDDSFEPVVAAGQNANPDPMATVLADDSDFEAATPIGDGPSEDLFADPGESLSPTPTTTTALGDDEPRDAARDSEFEFGFVTPPPTSLTPPPDLEAFPAPGSAPAGPDLMERAELDPAGSSAFDVSSSDLGDPFGGASERPPAPDRDPVAERAPEPDDERLSPAPMPEPAVTAPEAVTPFETEPPEVEAPDTDAPSRESAAPPAAHLSDVMQGRIHETLEKVAWEAFADLSDTIVRQVLERVERIAWEVIPQMAETLVREEIRKLKGESDD